jgi:phosphoribosylanthranilate isomerase
MRTRIKICGIKDKLSYQHAASLGVDAIGLMFYPESTRAITIEKAKGMLSETYLFVDVVAVFVNPLKEMVKKVIETLPITYLQFHGNETPEFCEQFNFPFIKAIRVDEKTNYSKLELSYNNASALLLDSAIKGKFGGTGYQFDWDLMPSNPKKPILLAGGLNKDNVGKAIAQASPYGVDVSGGVENAEGKKDLDKITQFIKAVNEVNSGE